MKICFNEIGKLGSITGLSDELALLINSSRDLVHANPPWGT
jgi:hypothetical protein